MKVIKGGHYQEDLVGKELLKKAKTRKDFVKVVDRWIYILKSNTPWYRKLLKVYRGNLRVLKILRDIADTDTSKFTENELQVYLYHISMITATFSYLKKKDQDKQKKKLTTIKGGAL